MNNPGLRAFMAVVNSCQNQIGIASGVPPQCKPRPSHISIADLGKLRYSIFFSLNVARPTHFEVNQLFSSSQSVISPFPDNKSPYHRD
ncbi:MAG: hypothetical protein CM15mP39_01730 [Synechococcus sp.]|nr:MAG: hypothetical protein CM15mP39_01730 [Synechococcus sp.]